MKEDYEFVQVPPPHDEVLWVKIIAHIKHNETGEVRVYDTTGLYSPATQEADTWIWEEGNYACDCNRRLFFARVKEEEEDWESPCSDGEYSVNVYASKGKLLYTEFN